MTPEQLLLAEVMKLYAAVAAQRRALTRLRTEVHAMAREVGVLVRPQVSA
jgi:hypothetical protein